MVIAKKWGNSVGVILPKEMVEKQDIKVGDDIAINIFKKGNLRDIFGTLKTKMTAQELKDFAREGWKKKKIM